MIEIQCITANFAQTMTGDSLGKIWLKNASHLAVACSIMPTQTQARCNSLLRKQKELNLEILSDGTEDLIELHDCYRQT